MPLFDDWCDNDEERKKKKRFFKFTEKDEGRETIMADLAETVRSHYDSLGRIADDVAELGYANASAILRERLPRGKIARSGDLGEILASELTEEKLGFQVPVRRMRFKDGREVALRGDDFIGIAYDQERERLRLLKGESKSRLLLGKGTITSSTRRTLHARIFAVRCRSFDGSRRRRRNTGKNSSQGSSAQQSSSVARRSCPIHDVWQRRSRRLGGRLRST
jgi:hypothetical protein